jgi:hypothetical protein
VEPEDDDGMELTTDLLGRSRPGRRDRRRRRADPPPEPVEREEDESDRDLTQDDER